MPCAAAALRAVVPELELEPRNVQLLPLPLPLPVPLHPACKIPDALPSDLLLKHICILQVDRACCVQHPPACQARPAGGCSPKYDL